MSQYRNDHYEREPLDSYHNRYDSPSRDPAPPQQSYSPSPSHTPYHDAPPVSRSYHPSAHPDSAYNRMQPQQQDNHSHHSSSQHSGSAGYESSHHNAPSPPTHGDNGYYNRSGGGGGGGGGGNHGNLGYAHPSYPITPGSDNFGETASGGMAGIAYNVADRNPRNSGMDAMHGGGQVPPPPSRSQYPPPPLNAYSPQSNGGYSPEAAYNNSPHMGGSHSSLAGLGAGAVPHGSHSPHRADPYADDPYQGFSSRNSASAANLGIVNPNDIEDDGDDGISYHRNQRNSMLSLPHSDRGRRAAATAAGAGGAAAAGSLLAAGHSSGERGGDYDMGAREKPSDWLQQNQHKSKKWKWAIIIIVVLIVAGGIAGGVVGSMLSKKGNGDSSSDSSSSGSGDSAEEDEAKNGDLGANSAEIKKLLNNANLHRVFPGMDYTPLNTQYPACLHNPPSQNNVTRDVAILSQLTNKIRLYGTDCNQTQMLLHAIDRLELTDTKVWLGVWQDGNETTNARQLEQMWSILDEYGEDPFEGVIVANEILFREEMTITKLGEVLDDVRTNLTKKGLSLPVATSDLGDDWTSELAADSDYIMANIHPFFAGVTAEEAAGWTYSFWENNNGQFWKTDKSKNIISETGWPTSGGTNCGGATTCAEGSVAGIDELNTFMEDWVCDALKNGTNYFWFEAFDEPWKVKFNTAGKRWEDQWGLLTVNRELKDGVKIPDCGGKTVG
ncbi:glycoside hydrolase superfamily [Dactylonectria macrodidyma]|uniref:glucan endo-1,3-beta-D-glucosidase n=1 Tax=Dactylonectria macrodidyma TaxID=307937 RepID=A0A9P9IMW1_9HYPO|nr:glycoside hydrolase superfamily [Dactylonectria macrodidyma]